MSAPAARSKKVRSARRRAPTPPPRPQPGPWRIGLRATWWLATGLLLVVTAIGIERKITWYLAVDQYGYLAFAHDLARGQVFHHWAPLDALAGFLPRRVDVLVQTYVWDQGRLYCRYAPGFPMLLAGWLWLFGDDGAHFLNPTVFIALLLLVLAFQIRIFRSRWRATAGMALVVLFPTMLHLWALTLTRDLSSHLAGFLGLFLLLPAHGPLSGRRMAAAGLALGYAGTIRPDGVIYLVPAVLLALVRCWRERATTRDILLRLGAGLGGVLVGLMPFFAYNWAATGSPFQPTQGMEIQHFLPASAQTPPAGATSGVGFPPGAWRGGTLDAVQGGGLRLEHLPSVLPGNIAILRLAYGDLMLATAVWGMLVALVRRRLLAVTALSYSVLALLFYSCWSRPDSRYLSGVFLFLPMLVLEGTLGTLDLARRLARLGWENAARGLAFAIGAGLIIGSALLPPRASSSALPTLAIIVPFIGGTAAFVQSTWPRRRVAGVAAPVLAIALVVLATWRGASGSQPRASFQRDEMLRARATLTRVVERGAVVITTEEVGRPAENIDYYGGGVHALYLTDLKRWRLSVPHAVELFLRGHVTPYLLLPRSQPDRDELLKTLRERYDVTLVADIPPDKAMDYFVAAAFHRGVQMELYRVRRPYIDVLRRP